MARVLLNYTMPRPERKALFMSKRKKEPDESPALWDGAEINGRSQSTKRAFLASILRMAKRVATVSTAPTARQMTQF